MTITIYNELLGHVFNDVKINEKRDKMMFVHADGGFMFHHEQQCCEDVRIEDVVGDLSSLIDAPILMAEKVSSSFIHPPDAVESHKYGGTWTFYKFATRKGYVTVRWLGESNGYYSEEVDFGVIRVTLQQGLPPTILASMNLSGGVGGNLDEFIATTGSNTVTGDLTEAFGSKK